MLKKFHLLALSMLVLFLFYEKGSAQQRFKAGVIFGLNAAQIRGDDVGGYNRLGLQGGLRAIAALEEKMNLSFELLYSQRGSYNKYGSPKCPNGDLSIFLQYIEVPILFSYKEWFQEEDGYYRLQASAGITYSRLLSASSEGSCHDDLTAKFNTNDYGFTGGLEYFLSPKLSVGVRWSKSFNLLYNKDKNDPGRSSLRGYFLSFRGAYVF